MATFSKDDLAVNIKVGDVINHEGSTRLIVESVEVGPFGGDTRQKILVTGTVRLTKSYWPNSPIQKYVENPSRTESTDP